METVKIIWACPKCGALPNEHGKGGADKCGEGYRGCQGFLCNCDADEEGHGESYENVCSNAVCYHCGWNDSFPQLPIDPKKLKGWMKTAWGEGWRPPQGWKPNKVTT